MSGTRDQTNTLYNQPHIGDRTADHHRKGFTITEMLLPLQFIGDFGFMALPNYFGQMSRTRQKNAALISQVLTSTMAFNDEFSEPPESWSDLNP